MDDISACANVRRTTDWRQRVNPSVDTLDNRRHKNDFLGGQWLQLNFAVCCLGYVAATVSHEYYLKLSHYGNPYFRHEVPITLPEIATSAQPRS